MSSSDPTSHHLAPTTHIDLEHIPVVFALVGPGAATSFTPATASERNMNTETEYSMSRRNSDVEASPDSSRRQSLYAPSPTSTLATPVVFDDARAWPTWKKVLNMAVLANMTLALTFSSSAFVASSTNLMERFRISHEVVLLGVSLFVLGFACGPLLLGPLAQLYGHRPVFVATYIGFTAMAFGVAEAPNTGAVLAFRFLAGAFGSSSLNNVPACVGDMTVPGQGAGYMMAYALSAFGGPGLGPLLGAFVDTRAGWRWNMRMQAIYVAACTIALLLFQSESSRAVLQQRAEAAQAAKHPWRKAPAANDGNEEKVVVGTPSKSKTKTLIKALYGPFVWLATEPVVMFICFYLSLLYAVLYMAFIMIPLAFVNKRHFGPESLGLIYISLIVGFVIGTVLFMLTQPRYIRRITASLAPGEQLLPETRLRQGIWAAFLPPVGLFIFAWTAPFAHVHWIGACIGMALFTCGMVVCFVSLIPYLVDFGGPQAPLVLSAATTTRSLFAAAFPLFATQMFDAMTIQGGCSMLAGVCLLMVPLPYVLTRFGPKWRAMSHQSAGVSKS